MPLETLENILSYSFGVIGVLLTMLIALVIYVFFSLKTEVLGLKNDIGELSRTRPKLVHRDDCRITSGRVHERLDEYEAQVQSLNERMTRVETTLDLTEHCS